MYSTFQRPIGTNVTPQQPAYLRLSLDNNGDGERDQSIFFLPANNPAQGPVQQSTWQQWRAFDGRWNINGDDGPGAAVTLKSYLVENPDSRIINNNMDLPNGGGLTVQVGNSGDNQRREGSSSTTSLSGPSTRRLLQPCRASASTSSLRPADR
ncbi:MAG: hypothetical protein WKF76_01340 [Nocardioidaceae bacterium]